MTKTIIASCMPEETRMALLEEGELREVSLERSDSDQLVGNIYKGRVNNVLPGMQAAFVDIGQGKNAFLYVGEQSERGTEAVPKLTVGQQVLVQIGKEAVGDKGPRATMRLNLPGRYIVLMPTVDYVGISRRIARESERERLKELANRIKPAGMGLIIRTVAEDRSEAELKKDVAYLLKLWTALKARQQRVAAPVLLYRDVDLLIRIVRDYLSTDVQDFILDNQEAYNRVCDLLQYLSPELISHVKLFHGDKEHPDAFACYGIEAELAKLEERRVELKNGAYLVIDKTEALTVIDVNTGKFVGRTNLEDTVFQTNKLAAAELARQLRLRDIGGIIIVDFIDMDNEADRQAILQHLTEQLANDKSKTNVLGFTALGLVEMTRKKARKNLAATLYITCPCCTGRGLLKSPQTVIISIKRDLRRLKDRRNSGCLAVAVSPQVAELLNAQEETAKLAKELSRPIRLIVEENRQQESYAIYWEKEK